MCKRLKFLHWFSKEYIKWEDDSYDNKLPIFLILNDKSEKFFIEKCL